MPQAGHGSALESFRGHGGACLQSWARCASRCTPDCRAGRRQPCGVFWPCTCASIVTICDAHLQMHRCESRSHSRISGSPTCVCSCSPSTGARLHSLLVAASLRATRHANGIRTCPMLHHVHHCRTFIQTMLPHSMAMLWTSRHLHHWSPPALLLLPLGITRC